jgi:hypothetical protein
MQILGKSRALATAAVICALATQAAVASASALCRAVWPESITQCQSDVEKASGIGVNNGGTQRGITVEWFSGTVNAQAAALNAQGQAIAGCIATDSTVNSGFGVTTFCNTASPPSFFFIAVD